MKFSKPTHSKPHRLGAHPGDAPANKGQTYPADPPSRAEVQRLLAACSRCSPTGARNRALFALMYRTGVRISEALALRERDIDDKAGTLRVLVGKGGKSRTVGIDAGTLAMLDDWVPMRRRLRLKRSAPLFCTLKGDAMSGSYVRQAMKRLGRKATIDRRLHPHALRHAFAVELVREGVPLPHIRAALGHSSLATTATYLASLAPQEAIDAIKSRAEWVNEDV